MARRSSVLSKRPLGVAALLLVVALVGLSLEGCFSAPRYSGPVTDHFAGKRFRNQVPIEDRGFGDVLRWRLSRKAESWKGYRPEIVKSPVVERVDGGDLRVTFIGHATVLIQIAGLNVLTDPIWAKRASPLSWAGPPRFAPPGLALLVTAAHAIEDGTPSRDDEATVRVDRDDASRASSDDLIAARDHDASDTTNLTKRPRVF